MVIVPLPHSRRICLTLRHKPETPRLPSACTSCLHRLPSGPLRSLCRALCRHHSALYVPYRQHHNPLTLLRLTLAALAGSAAQSGFRASGPAQQLLHLLRSAHFACSGSLHRASSAMFVCAVLASPLTCPLCCLVLAANFRAICTRLTCWILLWGVRPVAHRSHPGTP